MNTELRLIIFYQISGLMGKNGCIIERKIEDSLTGKCFSTSATLFTKSALGSSMEMATTFQSSSPSSIMANTASGFTFKTSPSFACLSPISTTSTVNRSQQQQKESQTEGRSKHIKGPKRPTHQCFCQSKSLGFTHDFIWTIAHISHIKY